MRSLRGWFVFVNSVLVFISCSQAAKAQEGALARVAAKEVVEFLGTQAEKQGVKAMANELAQFGGETVVREVFEQVAKESGEEGVKNVVRLSRTCGIDVLRAAKVAPRVTSRYMVRVRPELAPGALRALERAEERSVIERIDAELVPGALEAAARHPGVGAQVVEKLGAAGVRASERFDTDLLIQLTRAPLADKIAALPLAEKEGLVTLIANSVEKHPKTVWTGAALGIFFRYKDELLEDRGELVKGADGVPVYVPRPGVIERATKQVLVSILPVIGVIVGLWGGTRVFWAWKWSKLSHEVRAMRLVPSREQQNRGDPDRNGSEIPGESVF